MGAGGGGVAASGRLPPAFLRPAPPAGAGAEHPENPPKILAIPGKNIVNITSP